MSVKPCGLPPTRPAYGSATRAKFGDRSASLQNPAGQFAPEPAATARQRRSQKKGHRESGHRERIAETPPGRANRAGNVTRTGALKAVWCLKHCTYRDDTVARRADMTEIATAAFNALCVPSPADAARGSVGLFCRGTLHPWSGRASRPLPGRPAPRWHPVRPQWRPDSSTE